MKEEIYQRELLQAKFNAQKKIIQSYERELGEKTEQIGKLAKMLNENLRGSGGGSALGDSFEAGACGPALQNKVGLLENEISNKNLEIKALTESLAAVSQSAARFRQTIQEKFSFILNGSLESMLATRLEAFASHIRGREKELEDTRQKLKQKELQLELMLVDVRRP